MSAKLLIIGLDGATFDLLEPWAADGTLPTFARLLRAGASGPLRSVPNTSPGWATFATGLNPANHGIFHALGWSADRRTLRQMNGADCQAQTLWRVASDAGRRVIVINVPFTYPAEPLNGILLAGADAPGVDAPGFCHPPDLDVGQYRIASRMSAAIRESRPEDGLADAHAVAERRTATLVQALSQDAWDLAIIIYDIPDIVQHFFWHQQQQTIRDAYLLIERQIERLLACAGDDAHLIVLSDHGSGPICATPEHLAAWLKEQGFMRTLAPAQTAWQKRLTHNAYNWLRQRLSEGHKEALRRRLPGLRERVESDARFAGIDWSATTAYAGPSPYEIWINCQGREPQGIVAPGADYERVCQKVESALLDWRDPHSGKKRLQAVYRREQVYRGRYIDLAPDLTLEWNPGAAPDPATLQGNASRFQADHQPTGILLAVGPQFRAGATLHGACLSDLAPTILRLLDVPLPGPLDGRVLNEIFTQQERQR